MPATRQNKAKVPVGSDPYALTPDLAVFADSLNVNIPVGTKAERDALTPFEGMTVVRLDLNGIIETYVNGGWVGSGSTPITTFGTGWSALTTDGHTPRVYRSGGIVFLVGGVKIATGALFTDILTIPLGLRPSTSNTMFVGSGVASNGVSYELSLSNGVLGVPTGYRSGGLADGDVAAVSCNWPLY